MRRELRAGRGPVARLRALRAAAGGPQARAFVDRALALLHRLERAAPHELAAVEQEVGRLADELARRYGPARSSALQ